MTEIFKCVTNFKYQENKDYKIEFYLISEGKEKYGIKSVMYENNILRSTDVFNLNLTKLEAEKLIGIFCMKHVFPTSFLDVIEDMNYAENIIHHPLNKMQ